MGLLDAKSRIIDAVLTDEGRRQLALGRMKVESYSFTDLGVFYTFDSVSGSVDPTRRVSFEAPASLPTDAITYEVLDADNFRFVSSPVQDVVLRDGKLHSVTFNKDAASLAITGSVLYRSDIVTGSAFSSMIPDILRSSVDNFVKLRLIGTRDFTFDPPGDFTATPDTISFDVDNDSPLSYTQSKDAGDLNVNAKQSVFADALFSNEQRFQYLPPTNGNPGTPQLLGSYPVMNSTHVASVPNLAQKYVVEILQPTTSTVKKRDVYFATLGSSDRISFQVFEVHKAIVTKLDVYDMGLTDDKKSHVFAIGKAINDERGDQTFCKLFMMVFE